MKIVMRFMSLICALLCIGCIGLQIATSVGDAELDLTREFTYDDMDEAKANLPEEIEENGRTYVLDKDSVDYQERTVQTKYEEEITLTDLPSKDVPQTYETSLGGETVTLNLEDVEYTESEPATPTEVSYDYYGVNKSDIPQTRDIQLDDGTTIVGTLSEINEIEEAEWIDFDIDGQVVIPEGTNLYVFLGKVYAYNDASPLWDGYQQDLLDALNLNNRNYRITGGSWTGAIQARAEGGFVRPVRFYGQRKTESGYSAIYEVEPISITYTAKATYAVSLFDTDLDTSLGNASEVKICAIAHYVLKEVAEAGLFAGVYRNRLLLPLLAITFGIAALACAIVGFSGSHKEIRETYES